MRLSGFEPGLELPGDIERDTELLYRPIRRRDVVLPSEIRPLPDPPSPVLFFCDRLQDVWRRKERAQNMFIRSHRRGAASPQRPESSPSSNSWGPRARMIHCPPT